MLSPGSGGGRPAWAGLCCAAFAALLGGLLHVPLGRMEAAVRRSDEAAAALEAGTRRPPPWCDAAGPAPDPERLRFEAEAGRIRARAAIVRAGLHGFRPRVALKVREAAQRWQARAWEPIFERLGAALVREWTEQLRLNADQQGQLRAALAEVRAEVAASTPADPRPLIDVDRLAERLAPQLSAEQVALLREWRKER